MTSVADRRFNLLDEPWIPVRLQGGGRQEVGLLELFREAEGFVAIDLANPVQYLALHRLFAAIAMRAFGPGDPYERVSLLEAWTPEPVMAYLEDRRDAFWLFGGGRPFLQVPWLAEEELRAKPWTQLAPDRAIGAAKLLFDHSVDARPTTISAAEGVRLLVGFLQFTPGGLVKALRTSGSQGPACSILVTMPVGATLAETIALNTLPQAEDEYVIDLPAWEAPLPDRKDIVDGEPRLPLGPAQRYSWLSRSVLLRETDGGIVDLLFAEGPAAEAGPVPDPMNARIPRKDGLGSVFVGESRAFWRDFHVLIGDGGREPPRAVDHGVFLRAELGDDSPVALAAGGLLTDQARFVLWRLEERRFRPSLLDDGRKSLAIEGALELAETVGRGLGKALFALYRSWLSLDGARSPDKGDVQALIRTGGAEAAFWAELELRFWEFVARLSAAEDADDAMASWRGALRGALDDAWQHAGRSLGADGRAMAARAAASPAFGRARRTAMESGEAA